MGLRFEAAKVKFAEKLARDAAKARVAEKLARDAVNANDMFEPRTFTRVAVEVQAVDVLSVDAVHPIIKTWRRRGRFWVWNVRVLGLERESLRCVFLGENFLV